MPNDAPLIVIDATRGERHYWSDLWHYRERLYFLAWRDILVRYKQTTVGVAWAVVRPLVTMGVFTLVFGKFAQLPSEGMPYPLLVLSALLPWQFFATAVAEGSSSLINNANMVSKIYFPRIIVPVSAVAASVVDFVISLVIVAILLLIYGISPGWKALLLPAFLLMACVIALGMTVLFSALNVRYRDFRYIVGFIVQFGLYVSPVGFSSSVIPPSWQAVYALNPLVGIIDGFRWCLSQGHPPPSTTSILSSIAISAALLLLAIGYFRQTERTFSDVI